MPSGAFKPAGVARGQGDGSSQHREPILHLVESAKRQALIIPLDTTHLKRQTDSPTSVLFQEKKKKKKKNSLYGALG